MKATVGTILSMLYQKNKKQVLFLFILALLAPLLFVGFTVYNQDHSVGYVELYYKVFLFFGQLFLVFFGVYFVQDIGRTSLAVVFDTRNYHNVFSVLYAVLLFGWLFYAAYDMGDFNKKMNYGINRSLSQTVGDRCKNSPLLDVVVIGDKAIMRCSVPKAWPFYDEWTVNINDEPVLSSTIQANKETN